MRYSAFTTHFLKRPVLLKNVMLWSYLQNNYPFIWMMIPSFTSPRNGPKFLRKPRQALSADSFTTQIKPNSFKRVMNAGVLALFDFLWKLSTCLPSDWYKCQLSIFINLQSWWSTGVCISSIWFLNEKYQPACLPTETNSTQIIQYNYISNNNKNISKSIRSC